MNLKLKLSILATFCTRSKFAKDEDVRFIRDQIGDRKMFIDRLDRSSRKSTPKVKRTPTQAPLICNHPVLEQLKDDEKEVTDSENDSDFEPIENENLNESRKEQQITISNETIQKTMRAAIGLDISVHKFTMALTKLITEGGGDTDKLSLSYTSAFRMKDKILDDESHHIRTIIQKSIQENQSKVQLHFDGKLIKVVF